MLIRRAVPEIVAALAVYAGLAIAAAGFLRAHYLAPLVTSNPNVPGTAWTLGQWRTKDGHAGRRGVTPPAVLPDARRNRQAGTAC